MAFEISDKAALRIYVAVGAWTLLYGAALLADQAGLFKYASRETSRPAGPAPAPPKPAPRYDPAPAPSPLAAFIPNYNQELADKIAAQNLVCIGFDRMGGMVSLTPGQNGRTQQLADIIVRAKTLPHFSAPLSTVCASNEGISSNDIDANGLYYHFWELAALYNTAKKNIEQNALDLAHEQTHHRQKINQKNHHLHFYGRDDAISTLLRESEAYAIVQADTYAASRRGDENFRNVVDSSEEIIADISALYDPAALHAQVAQKGTLPDMIMRRLFTQYLSFVLKEYKKPLSDQAGTDTAMTVTDKALADLSGESYLQNTDQLAAYFNRRLDWSLALARTSDPEEIRELEKGIRGFPVNEKIFYSTLRRLTQAPQDSVNERVMHGMLIDTLTKGVRQGQLDYLFNLKDYLQSMQLAREAIMRSGDIPENIKRQRLSTIDIGNGMLGEKYKKICGRLPDWRTMGMRRQLQPGCDLR